MSLKIAKVAENYSMWLTVQPPYRLENPHKRRHSRCKLSQELKGKVILAVFFAKYTRVEMASRKRQKYQNKANNLCTICD